NIVRELNNEKVDIIRWSADAVEFAKEALKPIKILSIEVDETAKHVRITVAEAELSKAIGRKGQNARLTSRLIGYELIIEKDERAEKAFEGHMGESVREIVEAFGVTEEVARKLVDNGMTELSFFADASEDDIAGMLDGNAELAKQIVEKARAFHATASEG